MAGRDDFETTGTGTTDVVKKRLPIAGREVEPMVDVEAELREFEELERKRLGMLADREQWKDGMIDAQFARKERDSTTLLVCGLTMAHDFLIEGGLKGLGYNVMNLAPPDNEALRHGKEFGNRGQCNPTYYTVGNLVKFLCDKRDKDGMTTEQVIKSYVFVTAGACGPCRFGMYVTEYRKALRDAGFDGFRVLLFQQTGGFKQATGDEVGLDMNPEFFVTLTKATILGDILNALAYRIRPYEVETGRCDLALENSKRILYEAFVAKGSLIHALWKARKEFSQVKVDKLRAKPKVSIIGEFWAMTTEGDGNYQMHRFLESEGAEPDIQLVTAWLLYMLWEGRHDTLDRMELRGEDKSLYGLGGLGTTGVAKKMATLRVAELAARGVFQFYANVAGLTNYHLPDMNEIAEVSERYYSNDLRGGEGHMEVGKLILNSTKKKAHMTVSVKPFGCMPSASVSDGVQSMITEKFPGSIFCAVETSGDGRVNFYSRLQMYLFKARTAADTELQETLTQYGLTKEQVAKFLAENPRFGGPLFRADHVVAGSAADVVHAVAPYLTMSRTERNVARAKKAVATAKAAVPAAIESAKVLREKAPEYALRVRRDAEVLGELLASRGAAMNPLLGSLLAKAIMPAEA